MAFFQSESTTARSLFEEALAISKEMADRRGIGLGLSGLGWVALRQSDSVTARLLFEESLSIFKEVDHHWFIALCLEGLACVDTAQGQAVEAARLWGAAAALREALNAPFPPVIRPIYEQSWAAARTQLGEKAFAAAWAEGQVKT